MESETTQTNLLSLPFALKDTFFTRLREALRTHFAFNLFIIFLSLAVSVLAILLWQISKQPLYEARSIISIKSAETVDLKELATALTRPPLIATLLKRPEIKEILSTEARYHQQNPSALDVAGIRKNLKLLPGSRAGEVELSYSSHNPFVAMFVVNLLPLIHEHSKDHSKNMIPVGFASPQLHKMMLSSLEKKTAATDSPLTFVSPAIVPQSPLNFLSNKVLLLALCGGLLLGFLLIALTSGSASATTQLVKEVEKLTGLPVLGLIPATAKK